jgi:decaprenyl-phosphate phosphoribosyltransferase
MILLSLKKIKISFFLDLIKLARFRQWIKNGFVFAPLVFSGQVTNFDSIQQAFFATLIFCFTSSVVYILNDILDVSNDRRHPIKRHSRPIASGGIEIYQALIFMALLSSLVLFGLFIFPQLILPISMYLFLNFVYNLWLKSQPVLDIFCIAFGFTLRTFAGTAILNTAMSAWLFITVLSLALFLASIKRKQELINIGVISRPNLKNYSLDLINKYAEISATGALIFYSLFVISVRPELVTTIPFVIFGIFRYWYIVEKEKKGESPTDALINDWQLILNIVVWLLLSAYLIK